MSHVLSHEDGVAQGLIDDRAGTRLDTIDADYIVQLDGNLHSYCSFSAYALPQLRRPGWNIEVDADGRRLVVKARDKLVLRCGQASITLTRAGKVLIDGTYVSSRATGTNRVKGASIQLN